MQSVQRHFGRYMKRSADDKHVSVLLKDFEDAEQLLTKIIDASKAWSESWIAILTHQHRMLTEFDGIYQPILGAGADYQGHVAVETPEKIVARTNRLMQEYEELKRDLSEDLSQVELRMIRPAQSAKDSLLSMKKTIKKREDKKLDFERYQSRVDSANKKGKPSDRDRTALVKAQSDLATATDAYNMADEHLRQSLPAILTSVFSLLPHLLSAQIQIQNTLLGHYYTSLHNYCAQEGFPNPAPAMDEVIRLWSDTFHSVQSETENLPMLVNGKAIRMPMNQDRQNGYMNGNRRPSNISQRGKSVSPARALPPSPDFDVKPKISASPSPAGIPLLSPQETVASPSSTYSAYATPSSVPLTTFSPAGPNSDYFSRDRHPSSTSIHSAMSSSLSSAIAKKKPPPPPPRMNSQQFVFVTAMYDYGGQGEGDLAFKEGDRIKVLKATESKDDWWQGELRGIKGPFPANYCE